ncbi:MAG: TrbI/VirB10 family protein [Psittacicella sp.]
MSNDVNFQDINYMAIPTQEEVNKKLEEMELKDGEFCVIKTPKQNINKQESNNKSSTEQKTLKNDDNLRSDNILTTEKVKSKSKVKKLIILIPFMLILITAIILLLHLFEHKTNNKTSKQVAIAAARQYPAVNNSENIQTNAASIANIQANIEKEQQQIKTVTPKVIPKLKLVKQPVKPIILSNKNIVFTSPVLFNVNPSSTKLNNSVKPKNNSSSSLESSERESYAIPGGFPSLKENSINGLGINKDSTLTNASLQNPKIETAQKNNNSVTVYKNENMLLMHGTNIPIILKTRIVTDYAGVIQAVVEQNIYGANGLVVLIPTGSQVFGTMGKMTSDGINRVFITWTNIVTPQGISINIDSLGTGSLGATGAAAWINYHWYKRFGNSILLSFIEDAMSTASTALSNSTSNSTTTISTSNSTGNLDNMAQDVLSKDINIAPTAYINQGTLMNIVVARDINFSSVYKLKPIL